MTLYTHKTGNPKGRPIIFLHGLFGSSWDFSFLIRDLEKDYHLHFWDLPAHGKSDAFTFSSFQDFSDFLFEQLGTFKQKPNLVGYSLGGRIGLSLITQHSEFFNKAVIISANPGIESREERLTRLKNDKNLLDFNHSPEVFFNNWYRAPLFGNLKKHPNFPELLKQRSTCDLNKINSCMSFLSIGSQDFLWEKLKNVKIPILYLSGELDKKYDQIALSLKVYPNFEYMSFSNCGHNLAFEKPDLFKQSLTHFFYN